MEVKHESGTVLAHVSKEIAIMLTQSVYTEIETECFATVILSNEPTVKVGTNTRVNLKLFKPVADCKIVVTK